MVKRILFLSNGHGEDLNSGLIIQALEQQAPAALDIVALPIVGTGQTYRQLQVPIIGPTQALPSRGFNYISVPRLLDPRQWGRDSNPLNLLRDLFAGLIGLSWGQLRAVRRYSPQCDLIMATGDIVPILFAWIAGRPFSVFLVSTSSYYEGRIRLPGLAWLALRSQRCQQIFTRDAYTATDLQGRGLAKACYVGYPVMDILTPRGQGLPPAGGRPTVALLPGSRLPEALENLGLQLRLCQEIESRQSCQYLAALVASITPAQLEALARAQGWQYHPHSPTAARLKRGAVVVHCYRQAFADILHRCDLVLGMAGTAVEQAVGLGKPVVQIIGAGPQFTYPFAEAQMRLLGLSVTTIGTGPADGTVLAAAAARVVAILADSDYQRRCRENGCDRMGQPGGSARIAHHLQRWLYPQLHSLVGAPHES